MIRSYLYVPPVTVDARFSIFESAYVRVESSSIKIQFARHPRTVSGLPDFRYRPTDWVVTAGFFEGICYLLPEAIDLYLELIREDEKALFEVSDQTGKLVICRYNDHGSVYMKHWRAQALWHDVWPDLEVHNHFFDFVDGCARRVQSEQVADGAARHMSPA